LKMEMPLDFQRRGGGGKMRRVGNVGVCIANKKQRKKNIPAHTETQYTPSHTQNTFAAT